MFIIFYNTSVLVVHSSLSAESTVGQGSENKNFKFVYSW